MLPWDLESQTSELNWSITIIHSTFSAFNVICHFTYHSSTICKWPFSLTASFLFLTSVYQIKSSVTSVALNFYSAIKQVINKHERAAHSVPNSVECQILPFMYTKGGSLPRQLEVQVKNIPSLVPTSSTHGGVPTRCCLLIHPGIEHVPNSSFLH